MYGNNSRYYKTRYYEQKINPQPKLQVNPRNTRQGPVPILSNLSLQEGGVRGVRKPQNRVNKRKKPQYRMEIYQNTETVVTNVLRCRHHYF